jgi:hypothetical protein
MTYSVLENHLLKLMGYNKFVSLMAVFILLHVCNVVSRNETIVRLFLQLERVCPILLHSTTREIRKSCFASCGLAISKIMQGITDDSLKTQFSLLNDGF